MPIRGLDETRAVAKQGYFVKVPQGAFKRTRICIDGNWFVRKYGQLGNIHDILLYGNEQMVRKPLQKLIEFSKLNQVDLMWIWDGIDFDRPQVSIPATPEQMLAETFNEYRRHRFLKAGRFWRNLVGNLGVVRAVNKILWENKIVVVTAPYSATAQCAYFMNINACSYIFGKSDALLFEGVDKIILDLLNDKLEIDLVEVFHKDKFLDEYNMTPRLFSILGLVAGCELCPTVPNCAAVFSFMDILEIVQSQDLIEYIKNNNPTEVANAYTQQFLKAIALISYMPVMKVSSRVAPYTEDSAPANMEELVGAKLSPAFYEALFCNKMSPVLLHMLIRKRPEDAKHWPFLKAACSMLRSKKGKLSDSHSKPKEAPNNRARAFAATLIPSISPTEDLGLSIQLLILLSIRLGLLEAPFVPKLLCLCSQPFTKDELEIEFPTLRYFAELSQLQDVLMMVRQASELTSGDSLPNLFNEEMTMFSSAYYSTVGREGEPGRINSSFLCALREFLETNRELSPMVSNIIDELNAAN
jgi:hypothetical protein